MGVLGVNLEEQRAQKLMHFAPLLHIKLYTLLYCSYSSLNVYSSINRTAFLNVIFHIFLGLDENSFEHFQRCIDEINEALLNQE